VYKVCSIVHYDHTDMHKLTLKIEEVIAFTKWLSDNQISAKRAKSGIRVI
jgi:hypothetical protein